MQETSDDTRPVNNNETCRESINDTCPKEVNNNETCRESINDTCPKEIDINTCNTHEQIATNQNTLKAVVFVI